MGMEVASTTSIVNQNGIDLWTFVKSKYHLTKPEEIRAKVAEIQKLNGLKAQDGQIGHEILLNGQQLKLNPVGLFVEAGQTNGASNPVHKPSAMLKGNASVTNILNPQQLVRNALQKKYIALQDQLKKEKGQNGWIGNAWDWTKNTFNFGASSNKVQEELDNLKKQLAELDKNPSKCSEIYKNLTGKDLNTEELKNVSQDKINLKAETSLNNYKEGQKTAVDITADVISGIAAVVVYSAAVGAIPFTGGLSIAAGVAAAATIGAAVKAGVKYSDARNKRQYDSLVHDLETGAISGILAPISGGVGAVAGKTIATALKTFGVNAVQHTGVEVAEQSLLKSIVLNPLGFKYTGGNALMRFLPFLAEVETAGITFGSVDNSFRAKLDGQNVKEAAIDGAIGGLVGGLVLGSAAKGLGKAGKTFGSLFRRERIVIHTENTELASGASHEVNIDAPAGSSTTVKTSPEQTIDLSGDHLQSRIRTLNEGESFTVDSVEGGQPHLKVEKRGGRVIVTNMSEKTMSVEEITRLDLNKASDINFLYGKIQKQLQNASKEEIQAAIQRVMKAVPGATEKEVLLVMHKLTRYGNYKSLDELAQKLEQAGMTDVYYDDGTSLNSVLRYLMRKGHLKFSRKNGKKAYILDDAGLKYLEELKKTNPQKFELFMQHLKDNNVEFVVLDGFNSGINMFNADVDVADMSIQVLRDAKALMKKNHSLTLQQAIDEVMNKPTLDRAKALGIKPTRISAGADGGANLDAIVARLGYGGIQKETLEKIIDKIASNTYAEQPEKIAQAKKLLTAYLSVQIDVYSPKRLAQICKNLHKLIEKAVERKGKSMDDVYFVVPSTYKSYVYVAYQYAIANGIDPSRVISSSDRNLIPKGAVIVLLDDVVGSGNSMFSSIYSIGNHAKENDQTVIAAALVSTRSGKEKVSRFMEDVDFIVDDEQVITPLEETDFYKNLSGSDREMLLQLIGHSGFSNHSLAIRFPYMRPDNNSSIGDTILGYFHNRISRIRQQQAGQQAGQQQAS